MTLTSTEQGQICQQVKERQAVPKGSQNGTTRRPVPRACACGGCPQFGGVRTQKGARRMQGAALHGVSGPAWGIHNRTTGVTAAQQQGDAS